MYAIAWPVSGLFMVALAAVLGEMASAYPVAGKLGTASCTRLFELTLRQAPCSHGSSGCVGARGGSTRLRDMRLGLRDPSSFAPMSSPRFVGCSLYIFVSLPPVDLTPDCVRSSSPTNSQHSSKGSSASTTTSSSRHFGEAWALHGCVFSSHFAFVFPAFS